MRCKKTYKFMFARFASFDDGLRFLDILGKLALPKTIREMRDEVVKVYFLDGEPAIRVSLRRCADWTSAGVSAYPFSMKGRRIWDRAIELASLDFQANDHL